MMRSNVTYNLLNSAPMITVIAAFAVSAAVLLGGCPVVDEPAPGTTPPVPGEKGDPGADGLSCWDLNGNGQEDAEEDTNGDGVVDTLDCRGEEGADGEKGDTGDNGDKGEKGDPGDDGQKGDKGDQGDPGEDAATFIVASEAELRTAIDSLPAEGGKIVVRAGTYTLTQTIDIARDNVIIEGEGAATFLELADGADCPVFVVGEPIPFQPTITRRNITLRNLRINGNRANQTTELCSVPGRQHLRNNGITLRQVSDCTVENVLIEGARSGGIVLEQTCTNILLRGVITEDNEFDGIAWDGVITNSVISESTSRNNLAAGLSFDIGPEGNLIVDSFFVDNGSAGVFMRDCHRNLFADCFIARNGEDGVFIADGDTPGASANENYFDANLFVDNARNGIWQAGENSVNNVVDGGLFCGNGMNAIEESFPATAPMVVFDMFECP